MSYFDIQVNDTVTFRTPQGQERKGRAVMYGSNGWVLNCGGKYGTPAMVSEKNFVRLRKSPIRKDDYLGKILAGQG